MNKNIEIIEGLPHTTYEVGIQDLIGQQMQAYSLLMVILSFAILVYVLWNNFVRSPSKKKGIKQALEENIDIEKSVNGLFDEELGWEPSTRVKKISRVMDSYIIIPALVMFYITFSYYLAIRG